MSDMQRKLQQLPSRPPQQGRRMGPRSRSKLDDATPLKWSEFFDDQSKIEISPGNSFNVYRKNCKQEDGLVILALHGGGYSGLSWSCFCEEITCRLSSSLISPDLRAHGETCTSDDSDLSLERQAEDVEQIVSKIFEGQEQPRLLVIGHSMGGAIAVEVVHRGNIPNVLGLVVIDVVEGSALSALRFMTHFLLSRPQEFESLEKAIEWCVTSNTVSNAKSARVSMPAQLTKTPNGTYKWRIDLATTEKYWQRWFQGLSAKFLSVSAQKLLLLAGVDRLDRELTIGQMQGKFQMTVLAKVGHVVHEDSPENVAEAIAGFALRNKFTTENV